MGGTQFGPHYRPRGSAKKRRWKRRTQMRDLHPMEKLLAEATALEEKMFGRGR